MWRVLPRFLVRLPEIEHDRPHLTGGDADAAAVKPFEAQCRFEVTQRPVRQSKLPEAGYFASYEPDPSTVRRLTSLDMAVSLRRASSR